MQTSLAQNVPFEFHCMLIILTIITMIIMETLLFCVFECTIVNLATYRQFTNAACNWIIKKTKQNKNKNKKKRNQNCIKSGLFQFLHVFLQQKM